MFFQLLFLRVFNVFLGGFGYDFSTPKEDVVTCVNMVANGILAHGVTSFCPTVITSSPKKYHEVTNSLYLKLNIIFSHSGTIEL